MTYCWTLRWKHQTQTAINLVHGKHKFHRRINSSDAGEVGPSAFGNRSNGTKRFCGRKRNSARVLNTGV